MKLYSCVLLTLIAGVTLANAQQHPIDISSVANANWCGVSFINCTTFPFGTVAYNGVTFHIPGTSTTDNIWQAWTAANGGGGAVSVTVPVNIANVKTVYTLINTDWGSTTPGLLAVTFTGSGGATWTVDPRGNTNIRDYNNGGFTNAIDCGLPSGLGKTTTVGAFRNGKGQRLDMQIFELPASFAGKTLQSITIVDNGNTNVQRSFLVAVTVSTNAP